MKKLLGIFITTAVLLALGGMPRLASAEEPPPLETTVFKVEGMTCGGCEAKIQEAVKKLDGVKAVEASHQEGRAIVTYSPEAVTPEEIVTAIESLGYQAELAGKEESDSSEPPPQ